ncbi:MAG TPA: hypothetical protein VEY70_02460, partial [Metabacillus sp.]|nr:hypothetical protein [Metabacillus sp.]
MLTSIMILLFIISVFTFQLAKSLRTGDHHINCSYVISFIKKYGGNTLSHLLFLEDKKVFLA